MQSDTPQNVYK